jgi:ribosomal protein L35
VPKMKTHKGTQKRVRLTATGKVMVRTVNPKRAKRSRAKIRLDDVQAHPSVQKTLLKNLPYGDD